MKKYFLYFTAVVTMISMIFTTSCQRVENPSAIGVETEVTFSVSTPDIQTRAYSDGTTADKLTVAVYNGESLLFTEAAEMPETHADVTLTLVNGMNYNIVFWAQAAGAPYTFSPTDRTMTVDYNGVHANDENLDAFWKKIEYKSEGAKTQKVELTRPFAQLNIAASDWDEALELSKVEVKQSKVKVEKVYSKMDMFTGAVAEESEVAVEFGMNTTPNSAGQELRGYTKANGYRWLAMNYLLVNEQELVVVTFNTDCPDYVSEKVYRDIPVKRNFRTNIYGRILTSDTEFDVETKPGFDDEDNDVYVYEGVTYVPVADVAAANMAFAAGAKAVAIEGVEVNASIALPSTTGDVYLVLPATDKTVGIQYSDGGAKPAKLYVTIPEGVVSTLNIDATESTVYLNGDVTTLTAGTAPNTLYIVGGNVKTLNVAKGNVIVENYSVVEEIARTDDNQDKVTKVFASETATIPEETEDTEIDLGPENFEEDEIDKNKYKVYTLKGLEEFRDAVNGGNEFAGKTVVLTCDIDLNNEEWTPIKSFNGIFDGQNHTISNLLVEGGSNRDQGLFGITQNGEIKNLTVKNAKVSGRLNVGVVVGTPYTSKYTNIKVMGHVEVNGMAYVGGVGGKNAYADWTNVIVDVDPTSYVRANSVENGTAYRTYVGGVVGFNGEGGHTFKNITSNIDVEGSTCDVGGIFGIAHNDNKFENCSSSADVKITNATEASEAEELGGIAGVWHNETDYQVTFTNCSFTGTLSSNFTEGVDLNDNNIVGKAYGNGAGKLIIDGSAYVSTADQLVAALESKSNVVLRNNIKIDPASMSNAYGKTGLNVKYGQTIDGNNYVLDIQGAGGTWDSGINTTGGLIKNLTVTGSFRGIFINHNSTHSEKVVLENVTIDGTTYTISCDQGMNQEFQATNSTFNGWTSYAATLGSAKFVDCSFGEGNGYAYCRPYAPTEFVGCDFEEGYSLDPRAEVTFENCTIGGVALTAENLSTLVTNTSNVTLK